MWALECGNANAHSEIAKAVSMVFLSLTLFTAIVLGYTNHKFCLRRPSEVSTYWIWMVLGFHQRICNWLRESQEHCKQQGLVIPSFLIGNSMCCKQDAKKVWSNLLYHVDFNKAEGMTKIVSINWSLWWWALFYGANELVSCVYSLRPNVIFTPH